MNKVAFQIIIGTFIIVCAIGIGMSVYNFIKFKQSETTVCDPTVQVKYTFPVALSITALSIFVAAMITMIVLLSIDNSTCSAPLAAVKPEIGSSNELASIMNQ